MPIASQTQIVPFYEVSSFMYLSSYLVCTLHFLQVDADFAVDLLGELVRAYLAATNIRYQVAKYCMC